MRLCGCAFLPTHTVCRSVVSVCRCVRLFVRPSVLSCGSACVCPFSAACWRSLPEPCQCPTARATERREEDQKKVYSAPCARVPGIEAGLYCVISSKKRSVAQKEKTGKRIVNFEAQPVKAFASSAFLCPPLFFPYQMHL